MPSPWRHLWSLRPGVTYLNHGSFGPSPNSVIAARNEWMARLEAEPMDFFVRQLEGHLDAARDKLARFVGTTGDNLIFVDNATVGMNIIARSFPLSPGDEVLATNHEYGAVLRIWRERCKAAGANLIVQQLPQQFLSPDQVADALLEGVSPRTRLIVVSHITSPTALLLPVQQICNKAKSRGIPVCIDGPHALASVPVEIDRLGCDFYMASCHKWLSAPFGSGFLFVHPRRQSALRPTVTSWGRSLSGRPPAWHDEFLWSGTRDYSPFLAIPAAIKFLENLSHLPLPPGEGRGEGSSEKPPSLLDQFHDHARELTELARSQIASVTGPLPHIADSPEWHGPLIGLPLPDAVAEPVEGHMHPLQAALWEKFQIEVPVVHWGGRKWIRVSCHLYNDANDIAHLASALRELL